MYLTDLNKDGGIGANSLLLELGPFRILVDAGMHPKQIGPAALPDFRPIKAEGLDAIVLTHCHLDHLGALPLAARTSPNAPVITSLPNLTLAPRMLRNSINVMKRQRAEHGIREYPLFVHRDIAALSKQFEGQQYGRMETYRSNGATFDIALYPAGHVAGAAAVEIKYGKERIIFTGDVLFDAQNTLPGADLPDGPVDVLVLETTRGLTERPEGKTRETETQRLLTKITDILERGGSCLIPVFALGRMQEMLKLLSKSLRDGTLPRSSVFVTGLGLDLANHFDKIRQQTGLIDFDIEVIEEMGAGPLEPNLVPGRNPNKRGIYLVSSGMLVAHTPSYQVAASLLADKKNGICFIGYCDPDTPGGTLLKTPNGERFLFDAYDYSTPVNASVDQFDMSGHADREELVAYAVKTKAKKVVLTHGDPDARAWFAETLRTEMPGSEIIDPTPLERIGL